MLLISTVSIIYYSPFGFVFALKLCVGGKMLSSRLNGVNWTWALEGNICKRCWLMCMVWKTAACRELPKTNIPLSLLSSHSVPLVCIPFPPHISFCPPPLIFISHRGWRNSSTGSLLAMWLQNHGRTSANKRRLSDASTSSHSCNRILNSEWEECVSVCIHGGVSVCNETRGRSPEGLECVTSSQHFLDVMDASTDVRALTCPR